MKALVFTVTNDLNYDQRMIRICTSLANNGYKVTLVGVRFNDSMALQIKPYHQKRIKIYSRRGIKFYAEYNIKLWLYLLFIKADSFCAIDMDTILPVYFRTFFNPKKRIYDAHEYFSQQKEIVNRPRVYKIWHTIEKYCMPKFIQGYTVGQSIADEFKQLYGVQYAVIKNVPQLQIVPKALVIPNKIIYQGAVNHARGLEQLIPAMKNIDAMLHIYGDGNFMEQTKQLITQHQLNDKITLHGKFLPSQLNSITASAYIGINLVENVGLNQYYSLANKFFDYIQHGVPQVSMNYPEYKRINDEYEVAVLIENTTIENITNGINCLLKNETLYHTLKNNCTKAAKHYNWAVEEKKLLTFYKNIFE